MNYRNRTLPVCLAGMAVFGMLFTGAGAVAADKATIAAAEKEGELVWYTTLIVKQAVRPLVAAFTKKYPKIKVRYSRANSTATAIKILSEARANNLQADIFDGTSTAEPLKDAGLLVKWTPSVASEYPPEYKDKDGYWVATHLYFLTPGINTSLIPAKDAPKTFDDLLNPKFKGKIIWSATSSTSGAAGFVGNVLMSMGEEKGMAYLRKFAAQKPVAISASARKVLDQVIAGEFAIGLQIFNHHTVISGKKGAPVTWIPMEPVTNVISPIGLLKGARHPNAGKLFLEFILSKEGQKVLQQANYLPAHPDIPAKTPTLKPKEGGFKVNIMEQKLVHREEDKWKKVFNDLFR